MSTGECQVQDCWCETCHPSEKRTSVTGSPRTEWTLRVDCAKNGCYPKHSDDGEQTRTWTRREEVPKTINGHAAKVLSRTIYTTPWMEEQ